MNKRKRTHIHSHHIKTADSAFSSIKPPMQSPCININILKSMKSSSETQRVQNKERTANLSVSDSDRVGHHVDQAEF